MGIFRFFAADPSDRSAARSENDAESQQDEGRRRARRRVVGAIILVMVALIVLPVIFETGDPPIADTVAIDIPAKDSPVEFSPSGEPTNEVVSTPSASNTHDKAVTSTAGNEKATGEFSLPPSVSASSPSAPSAPPTLATPAPVRPPIPPIRGGYALQVGAFASNASAQALQHRITTAGLNAYIETLSAPQGTRYRVRVGPFPNRDGAEQARSKLKLLGLDNTLIDAL